MRKFFTIGLFMSLVIGVQSHAADRALEPDDVFNELAFLVGVRAYAGSHDGMNYLLENGVVETINKVLYKQLICLLALCASGTPDDGRSGEEFKVKPLLPNTVYPFRESLQNVVSQYNLPTGQSLAISAGVGLSVYSGLTMLMQARFSVSGELLDALARLTTVSIAELSLLEKNRLDLHRLRSMGLTLSAFSKVLELNWQLIARLMGYVLRQKSLMAGYDVLLLPDGAAHSDAFGRYGLAFLDELRIQSNSHDALSVKGVLLYVIQRANTWFYRWNDGKNKGIELLELESFERMNVGITYENMFLKSSESNLPPVEFVARPPRIEVRVERRGASVAPAALYGDSLPGVPRRRGWRRFFACCSL